VTMALNPITGMNNATYMQNNFAIRRIYFEIFGYNPKTVALYMRTRWAMSCFAVLVPIHFRQVRAESYSITQKVLCRCCWRALEENVEIR
jgi:hypothetical protein